MALPLPLFRSCIDHKRREHAPRSFHITKDTWCWLVSCEIHATHGNPNIFYFFLSPQQPVENPKIKGNKHSRISHTWQFYTPCGRGASQSYPAPLQLLKMRTLLTLRPQPSPCLYSFSPPSSFLNSFRPHKRFHFLRPCSSLKQTKKQTLQKNTATPGSPPQSLKWLFNSPKSKDGGEKIDQDEEGLEGDSAIKGTILAGVFLVGFLGGFAAVGYIYKDQINAFLTQFSTFIEGTSLQKFLSFSFAVLCDFFLDFVDWSWNSSCKKILLLQSFHENLLQSLPIGWWEILAICTVLWKPLEDTMIESNFGLILFGYLWISNMDSACLTVIRAIL